MRPRPASPSVCGQGYLRLMSVAGNDRVLPGQEVQIRTFGGELARGVVGIQSAHLTPWDEMGKAVPIEQLYVYPVDDGREVEIEVGNTVSLNPAFRRLGDGFVCSKSLDDRVGCCVLLETMRRLADEELPVSVAFVGTVQEEIGCDGALAPAQELGVEMAIAIDGTVSYDTPDTPPAGEVRCCGGPVITRMLRTPGLNGWTPNPQLALSIEEVARRAGIPIQRDAVYGLMSDAKPLRLGDVPSALIGIPMRAKHSSVESVALADVESTIELVVEVAKSVRSLEIERG